MQMQPIDTMGSLYSSGGLRFGGLQTSQFFELTEELEKLRPGVREEIVGEAHYLAYWLHRLPEIAFFVTILISKSLLTGGLYFIGGYIIEIIRFYTFGVSPLISHLCRFWNWIKVPLFIGAAILLWPEGKLLPITLIAFLILQGGLSLLSTVFMLPIRLPLSSLTHKIFGKKNPNIHNMEGMTMQLVIDRWHRKLVGA